MEGFSNQIRVGAKINAGTYLGKMGNTTTLKKMGVHLHLMVKNRDNETLDPGKLLGFGDYTDATNRPVEYTNPY